MGKLGEAHGGGGEGCGDMIWQGCQAQSPDASRLESNLPRLPGMLGPVGNQSALAGRRGWTGEPEFKGAAEGGDRRREGGRPRREEGGEVSVNHIN